MCALLAAMAAPERAPAHGAFHERMAQLAAVIERSPGDARAHFELAELFCHHGDWALALGAADSADEAKPNAFPTDLIRGEAHLRLGRAGAARAALDRYLTFQPGQPRALMLRAQAHAAAGDQDAALADYRSALQSREKPNADHVREATDALFAAGYREEAHLALGRALAALGPDPALLQHALALAIAAGRFDDALSHVAALEAGAPRREPWMVRRAQLLARAGRPAEARVAWQHLLQHLEALPNLERGQPALRAFAAEARTALAEPASPPAFP